MPDSTKGQHPADWMYGKNDTTAAIESGPTTSKTVAPEKCRLIGMVANPDADIAATGANGVLIEIEVNGVASGVHIRIPEGQLAGVGGRFYLEDAAELELNVGDLIEGVYDSLQILACDVTSCWILEGS